MNKTELKARAQELGLDLQALDAANKNGTATNAELEAAIKAKEAELENENENEDKQKSSKQTPAPKTPAKPSYKKSEIFEDDRGLKWAFKKCTPKTLNIDGRSLSQKQILDSKEIMTELVYGNNTFLTQIH